MEPETVNLHHVIAVLTSLIAVIGILWTTLNKQYRIQRAMTQEFTQSTVQMTNAVEENTEICRELKDVILQVFGSQELPFKKRK